MGARDYGALEKNVFGCGDREEEGSWLACERLEAVMAVEGHRLVVLGVDQESEGGGRRQKHAP